MRVVPLLALVSALGVAPAPVRAQAVPADSAKPTARITHVLRTREGSTFLGRIVGERGDSIHFETSGGVLVVARSTIDELKPVAGRELHDGVYWFADPNRTRLFFAPTARMLSHGEGYYSNTYLFLQTFAGGMSDRMTMGGGMTLVPAGLDNQVFYLTPKVGLLNSETVNVAAGALLAFAPMDDGHAFGILYSVATYGGADGSMTAGLGWGYFDNELANRPAVMVGGAKRVSRRVSFITENYLFPGTTNPLASYGVRFFGEKLATDLAMIYPMGSGMPFPGVPFVSFTVKF
jgi:hypothetical protein